VGGNSFGQEYGSGNESYESPPIPTGTQIDDYLNNLRRQGKPISIGIVKDLQSGKIPIPTAPATPIAAQTNPLGLNNTKPQMSMRTDFSDPKSPGTPGTREIPGIPGGFRLPSMKDVNDATKSQFDFYEDVFKNQIPKLAFDKAKYDEASGDVTAATKRLYTEYQNQFPDPNKEVRSELSKLKQANEAEGQQIPNMSMLKMGLSLMATKSSNFLQAFGESGGAGLEDYTKAINLQKQQKIKLMEADAHAAAAQDARSQNMFGRANAQAMQEKQSRMEAFRAEADAKATTVGLQIQYLGAKAQLPLQTIKIQKELGIAAAQLQQAFKEPKPEMQKLFELVSTNPRFAKFFQTQESVSQIRGLSDDIIKAHSREVKIAEDAGKEPPDFGKFYNEKLSVLLNAFEARRAAPGASNLSSPLRPISFGGQPQQQMPFFNQTGR